jgi:iron complex outermembrane receptor protein
MVSIINKAGRLALCLFSFYVNHAVSQKLTISGRVSDSLSGKPLPGATVTLTELRRSSICGESGDFYFKDVSRGHFIIEVTCSGYAGKVEHLDLAQSEKNLLIRLLPTVIEGETVVVTAVGSPTSYRKAPVSLIKVSKTDLLQSASTNLIDALSRQPGISQLTTGPAISKPFIRGLGYNRLVLIHDGIRQEGQQWGDEHGIEIDQNNVQQVEIVKGPASIMYGSDALAGVINVSSQQTIPRNSFKGNLLSGYMTNNRQQNFHGNLQADHGGLQFSAAMTVKRAADYQNRRDGYVYNSKFREDNLAFMAGINRSWGFSHWQFSSFNQLAGVVEGERDDQGRFIKPLPGGEDTAASDNDFLSTRPGLPYQHIRHQRIISDNHFRVGAGRISLVTGWQNNRRLEYGDPDQPETPELEFGLTSYNYRVSYHLPDRRGWNHTWGINGMQQRNRIGGEEFLIPEYDLTDFGAYYFTQGAIGKFNFSGGLRWDGRALQSRELLSEGEKKFNAFDRRFSNYSFSAGFSYLPDRVWTLKANFARGFRAPNIPELASNGAHEGTNRFEYGEINLKPEVSHQFDLGIEAATDHLLFGFSGFVNSISDFIYYSRLRGSDGGDSVIVVDDEELQAFRFNQQNALLAGFECKLDLHPHPFDWLHLETGFSWVRGLFQNEVEGVRNLPLIPAPRLQLELRAELAKDGRKIRNLSVFTEYDHSFSQKKAFTAFNTETITPGFGIINSGFHFDWMRGEQKLLQFYFTALNCGDQVYQNHLSRLKYAAPNPVNGERGVFNMGRNFNLKLNIPLQFSFK